MTRLTNAASSVSDALNTRFSCRAFLDKPVAAEDVRYLIETATRARPPVVICNPGIFGRCKATRCKS